MEKRLASCVPALTPIAAPSHQDQDTTPHTQTVANLTHSTNHSEDPAESALAQSAPATVDTAVVCPSDGTQTAFGRPLLERTLLHLRRVGVQRFFIQAKGGHRARLRSALGAFAADSEIHLFENLDQHLPGIGPTTPCILVRGDLAFSRSHLNLLLSAHADNPANVMRLHSAGITPTGELAAGPFAKLVEAAVDAERHLASSCELPFAFDGSPEAPKEAELRLARAIREETTESDGLLARLLDRRVSWAISLVLARVGVNPNHVTLANTALGWVASTLFASPAYWTRVVASVLFLISVTLDGVDGEVARLRMVESEAGRRLDVITDNIVNLSIFIGIMVGCYRASGSVLYLYLLLVQLGGFGLCALAVHRALSVEDSTGGEWTKKVDRLATRDFAYLLLALALFNRLQYFAWGTAFGTYVFAFVLSTLTRTRRKQVRGLNSTTDPRGL